MAGSQLKQLKAALKEGGLTGQTNIKKKKGTKKAPSDTRRDDRQEVISKIREQFNPFEIKVNKKKKDYDTTKMKGGQGKPGISKQIGEEQRMAAYEAKKARKNKTGLMRDRRFGEADSTLTPEQKMLERFTRERQMQSKTSLFSLDDEDDEMDADEGLTHYGKSLAAQDDFEIDDDLEGSDDDFMKPKKRSLEDTEDAEGETTIPQKKKTKAEVMKEVIAKSKFYKQQRQIIQEKAQEKIMDLDEEFEDVMSDLRQIPKQKPAPKAFSPEDGPSYEMTVKELAMDRRAAPADRTKTDEEIKRERAEKMRELESARLRRMEAMDEQDKGPDDLDDDFWAQGSEDEGEGFAVGGPSEDEETEEEEEVKEHHELGSTSRSDLTCPESHEDWLDMLEELPLEETVAQANKILKAFAPHLMHGNKDKLAVFTVLLFQHILYLSESNQVGDEKFTEVQEGLISLVKKLSEKYNIELTEALRDKIQEIHERIVISLGGDDEFPMISDLAFFTVVGMVYSTSDHFHLVVTPASIVMGEALEQLKYTSLNTLLGGSFISQVFLLYQRYSKRYIPEVVFFLQKALLSIAPTDIIGDELTAKPDVRLPLPVKIPSKIKSLRISDVDRELGDSHKFALFQQILSTLELALDTWKDKSALIEISRPFVTILSQLQKTYPDFKPLVSLSQKFNRLLKFSKDERKPLTLQEHKKLAIATYAPKFEENFNPEKKSYDPNRQRQEISKMRSQVKQERKIALREMRKDTRFEARQQIKEKKESYAAYHSKMARIMNQINTVEGAEKNEYEREKKLRKGKK